MGKDVVASGRGHKQRMAPCFCRNHGGFSLFHVALAFFAKTFTCFGDSSPTTPPLRSILEEGFRVRIPSPPSKPRDATSGIIKNQRVEPCLPRPPHRSRTGIPQRTPLRRSGLWEPLHSLPCRICHCCPAVNRRIISVSSDLRPSHRDVAGSP